MLKYFLLVDFKKYVCEGGWYILYMLLLYLHLEINYHIILFALPLAN